MRRPRWAVHFRPLLVSAAVAALLQSGPVAAQTPDAAEIHRQAIVIDAHVDIPSPSSRDTGTTGTIDAGTQIDFDRLRAGGIDTVFAAVFVEQGPRTPAGYAAARAEAESKLRAIRAIAETRPREAVLALSADDIERAAGEGRTAILLSFLNAYSLGNDPEALRYFYEQGVRVFGLTHAGNNDFADSSRPQARDRPNEHGGLSPAGRAAIALANRLGILLDVSQLSSQAFAQAVAASRAPVIASHSSARALVDNVRNLSDAELDAIAANGGVVAINAFNSYLRNYTDEERARIAAARARYNLTGNGYEGLSWEQRAALARDTAAVTPRANLDHLIDHVDHVVRRIGIDHVALSSDFNHGGGIEGWANASETGQVTAALLRRGYSRDDIAKLWGGNVLRVLRTAQASAG